MAYNLSLMIPAPTPPDEDERLADLRALDILDTPPEKRFDNLVELATTVVPAPIAYIAMVDADRQWFKAKCGVDADQTGRRESFCGHTILQAEPLIIPDARLDERFHDNPLVTGEPFVRFYAGFPLAGPNGHNVGTLCVADPQPRRPDELPHDAMRKLADIAQHELNMIDVIAAQRELIETKNALVATRERLAGELRDAAAYVHSLIPRPLDAPVATDWRFIASSDLGGDLFGHHVLPSGQLAVYLLDVCGHGVAASLLSASAYQAVRTMSLPGVDFTEPASVLAGLNRAFPMEQNANKFFTIWYGVYDPATRQLAYAAGGHHPAVLFAADTPTPVELGEPSFMIGAVPDAEYPQLTHTIAPGSRLYLFSDGAFELRSPDGDMLNYSGLVGVLAGRVGSSNGRLDSVVADIRDFQGREGFGDDFSMLEITFG